jgi:hypothetical protein
MPPTGAEIPEVNVRQRVCARGRDCCLEDGTPR